MTDLTKKAIDIKGKKYVLVSDRILAFNEMYPEGSITTEVLSAIDAEVVVVKATAKVGERTFTGHSQAKWGDGYINKTSALENCETSAVGRALAMMGIGVIDSVASVDEINKAENSQKVKQTLNKIAGNGYSSDPIMKATSSTTCNFCHAPAGKPHATNCPQA